MHGLLKSGSRVLWVLMSGIGGGRPPDDAIYTPLDNRFSEGDSMTMTITVDLSTECDARQENTPQPPHVCEKADPNDCGRKCYYNGMVVALTLEIGDYYRCDYGRAEPYPYPASALTYPGDDGYGYQEDMYQYNAIHDEKLTYEINPAGEFVDHIMMEHRLFYKAGDDLYLTGVDYYDGDLGGHKYTWITTGCSFAINTDNDAGVDNTDFPVYDLPIDPDPYDQQKLCRWALLFGREDKIAAAIQEPYKVQGALTSYEVIDTNLDADVTLEEDNSGGGGCFISTAAISLDW